MLEYEGPKTKGSIQEALTVKYNPQTSHQEIFLSGQKIGNMVRHGKRTGLGNHVATVYASRIYGNGMKIEEEASTSKALLNKVATELARQLKTIERKAEENQPASPPSASPRM